LLETERNASSARQLDQHLPCSLLEVVETEEVTEDEETMEMTSIPAGEMDTLVEAAIVEAVMIAVAEEVLIVVIEMTLVAILVVVVTMITVVVNAGNEGTDLIRQNFCKSWFCATSSRMDLFIKQTKWSSKPALVFILCHKLLRVHFVCNLLGGKW
jgi:hypothetical protein